MHGRLKVKTTAEQQEAKRKEREKKMKLYMGATQKVFQKRKDDEYDDEALELTGQLLSANPDFSTCWNYRREVFLQLTLSRSSSDLQDLYASELKFLESCLVINPKSYGAWHHRTWVMDHMPEPDWKRELDLCNQYLEYDERNFHCWDYRRCVVSKADIKPEAELEFSTKKISSNFSNYSSWHYRSKLLPLLYPDPENRGRVTEEILLQEYELVQNAFFTDPNDQSAWFYQRWLLGRAERPQAISLLYVSREPPRILAVFAQPVKVVGQQDLTVVMDDATVGGSWRNSKGELDHDVIWLCELTNGALLASGGHEIHLSLADPPVSRHCTLSADQTDSWTTDHTDSIFTAQLSMEKSGVLTQELESCQQLQELEPDNKWCMLTIVFLMRAIDPVKYEPDTLRYLDTLLETDPCRAGYFNDLRSKFLIENALTRNMKQPSGACREIDLSDKNLATICHTEYMVQMTQVNLSSNQLSALKGCHYLQCARTLLADSNSLGDLSSLSHLQCLETLSIKDNCILTIDQLQPLASCTRLQHLNVTLNPVCDVAEFRSTVRGLVPSLVSLNGEVV